MRRSICAIAFALLSTSSVLAAPRPFVFVVDSLHGIAKIDTANFTVACRNTNVAGSDVIWGLSGTSNGSLIFAAITNGTLAVIDGNNCNVISTPSMGAGCPGPEAVAAFPDGSRMIVVCGGGPALYLNSSFVPLDTAPNFNCSVVSGYHAEKEPFVTVMNMHVACQGTGTALKTLQANGNTLFVGPNVPITCTGNVRDVALQNANFGCDYGAYVCEGQNVTDAVEFLDAGCAGQKACKSPVPGAHAVAHEQNDNRRAWIVDDSQTQVHVYKPENAGCVFVSANLNFDPDMVILNPQTTNTAFVVGIDGCGGGGIAEVDRNGTVLRQATGLSATEGTPSADGIFAAIMG